jgi:hypothetical protein
MAGQPDNLAGGLKFDLTGLVVTEFGGGVAPATIIDINNNWDVEGAFSFQGAFAVGQEAAWAGQAQPVEYYFEVTAESMGTQAEVSLGFDQQPLTGQSDYGPGLGGPVPTVNVIPANQLPAGVWKLTGIVTFIDPNTGNPPVGTYVGWCEGPIIQVYQP